MTKMFLQRPGASMKATDFSSVLVRLYLSSICSSPSDPNIGAFTSVILNSGILQSFGKRVLKMAVTLAGLQPLGEFKVCRDMLIMSKIPAYTLSQLPLSTMRMSPLPVPVTLEIGNLYIGFSRSFPKYAGSVLSLRIVKAVVGDCGATTPFSLDRSLVSGRTLDLRKSWDQAKPPAAHPCESMNKPPESPD